MIHNRPVAEILIGDGNLAHYSHRENSRFVILENSSTPEIFSKVHRNIQAIFTLLEHTPGVASQNLQ